MYSARCPSCMVFSSEGLFCMFNCIDCVCFFNICFSHVSKNTQNFWAVKYLIIWAVLFTWNSFFLRFSRWQTYYLSIFELGLIVTIIGYSNLSVYAFPQVSVSTSWHFIFSVIFEVRLRCIPKIYLFINFSVDQGSRRSFYFTCYQWSKTH